MEQQALNVEQRHVLEKVQGGATILLTGPAGTGKTFTLRAIIQWAHDDGKRLGITALTGSAALLLGGRTLHSFLGIGLAKKDAKSLAETTIKRYHVVASRLRALDMLIIDEVSMANAQLIDTISTYLQILRRNQEPFGGLQIVFCGDFCQLPPVDGKYAFQSDVWQRHPPTRLVLTTLVRQTNDLEFQDMLSRLRWGKFTAIDFERLKSLHQNPSLKAAVERGICPTRLYAVNRDVDAINMAQLDKLIEGNRSHVTYTTRYEATLPDETDRVEAWATSCNIPARMKLSVDSQVVLTTNLSPLLNLVNGSRGKVVELEPTRVCVEWVSGARSWVPMHKVSPEDMPDDWRVTYMPLKLAWAITIHKSQGMTLDAIEVDIGSSIFAYGQAYTALSRARDLDSITVIDVSQRAFRTHPDVLAYYGNA